MQNMVYSIDIQIGIRLLPCLISFNIYWNKRFWYKRM